MPSQIVDEQACFLSKAFLIRYCEEEVEVNDAVLFRAELDVEGLCEFVPVTFQDQYFSLLKIQVWSVLLDFRFRLKQLNFAAQTAGVAASTAI